jgi:hypothetical protein
MQSRSVVLPLPLGPNRAVTPVSGRLVSTLQAEAGPASAMVDLQ